MNFPVTSSSSSNDSPMKSPAGGVFRSHDLRKEGRLEKCSKSEVFRRYCVSVSRKGGDKERRTCRARGGQLLSLPTPEITKGISG